MVSPFSVFPVTYSLAYVTFFYFYSFFYLSVCNLIRFHATFKPRFLCNIPLFVYFWRKISPCYSFSTMLFSFNDKQVVKLVGYDHLKQDYFFHYTRNFSNWSRHLLNTKRNIIDAASNVRNKKSCVVLGSGYCFDVPVMELSKMFQKVVLVDIVHPYKVKSRISNFKNVSFVTEDVTKMVVDVYNALKDYNYFTVDMLVCAEHYKPPMLIDALDDFDFVVSDNLWAFLWLLPVQFLATNRLIDNLAANKLRDHILKRHLSFLPKGKSCMITPVRKIIYSDDSIIDKEYKLPIFDLPLPVKSWFWTYNISPSQQKTCYKVNTYLI